MPTGTLTQRDNHIELSYVDVIQILNVGERASERKIDPREGFPGRFGARVHPLKALSGISACPLVVPAQSKKLKGNVLMGKPIARISDNHSCPMADGPKPHVGGPIVGPSASTVLAEDLPVAVVGDMATCAGPPDSLVQGSSTVFAEGKPASKIVLTGRTPTKRLPNQLSESRSDNKGTRLN